MVMGVGAPFVLALIWFMLLYCFTGVVVVVVTRTPTKTIKNNVIFIATSHLLVSELSWGDVEGGALGPRRNACEQSCFASAVVSGIYKLSARLEH